MIALSPLLQKILGLPKLERQRKFIFPEGASLWSSGLKYFGTRLTVRGQENVQNLNHRPVVFVANHPYGLMETIVFGYMLEEVLKRKDFKFVANQMVEVFMPELKPYVISVDNMSFKKSTRAKVNHEAFIDCVQHLNNGRSLVLFPAGKVSGFKFHSPEGWFKVTDSSWKPTPLKLMTLTDAIIVPVYVSGRNGVIFQIISLFGSLGKRLISVRWFLRSKKLQICLTIGKPVQVAEIQHLRRITYALGEEAVCKN